MGFRVLVLVLFFAVGCSSTARFTSDGKTRTKPAVRKAVELAPGTVITGNASYYGNPYHGRPTASGEIFDMNKLTAAHREWAFGTRVKVTNQTNGKSVIVRINDRGPFVPDRIIDLSVAAATALDMMTTGVAPVRLEIVQ